MTRDEIVAEAWSWVGTPYHHMGAVKGAGVDCGQLLIQVYHAVGAIPLIDAGYYPSDWHFHRSEEKYLGWVEQYAHEVVAPDRGDIAVFRFGRCISHGAIIIGDGEVIHAQRGQGCVKARLTDAELAGRCVGFYSLFKGA